MISLAYKDIDSVLIPRKHKPCFTLDDEINEIYMLSNVINKLVFVKLSLD
jgi:hypothetical protein